MKNRYPKENRVENIDEIKNWLRENGGYCDCEVLNNVEEMFEENTIL